MYGSSPPPYLWYQLPMVKGGPEVDVPPFDKSKGQQQHNECYVIPLKSSHHVGLLSSHISTRVMY